MNTKEFVQLLQETWDSLEHLSATKGQEYAHSADRLANFKRLAVELEMEPEKVLWVYWTKHKDSLLSHINELSHEVRRIPSEPIEGRIDDAILYLILLKGLLRERGGLPKEPNAEVRVSGLDAGRLQSGGQWDPGSLVRDHAERHVDRDKVAVRVAGSKRVPVRASQLLHEAAGELVEKGGQGDGSTGRGCAASGDPV